MGARREVRRDTREHTDARKRRGVFEEKRRVKAAFFLGGV
jgi:hypothetical protein